MNGSMGQQLRRGTTSLETPSIAVLAPFRPGSAIVFDGIPLGGSGRRPSGILLDLEPVGVRIR